MLTRKHWQVPFPSPNCSRPRQNFIHSDTTLLPRYYTVLSKEILSTTFIGSPATGTVLVKIPSLILFATRSIGAWSRVHNVRSYRQADNACTLGPRAVE